jgi:hypothetical protein
MQNLRPKTKRSQTLISLIISKLGFYKVSKNFIYLLQQSNVTTQRENIDSGANLGVSLCRGKGQAHVTLHTFTFTHQKNLLLS